MAIIHRSLGFTLMGLILVFALIHLGVSIGIIVRFRDYGSLFRPQIGLSAFNLVIFIFALVTGILGIVALAIRSEGFGKGVCVLSGVVGVFALASLITALVINDKSPSYVNSQLLSSIGAYTSNTVARQRMDDVQSAYQCCGSDTWIDWIYGNLNGSSTGPNSTTTTPTTTVSVNTTPIANTTSSVNTTAAPGNSSSGRRRRHVDDAWSDEELPRYARNKRQAISNYGGIVGLPTSFGVVLPSSCCTSNAILTNNSSSAYCISNANGTVNSFRSNGCSRPVERIASNQATAFIVINSFLVAYAFTAIPVLLGQPSDID